MSTKEIKQNNFSGGLTENIRDTSGNKVWYTENVIIENGAVSQTVNNNIQNSSGYSSAFGIIREIEGGGLIWGLGQDNNTNKDVTVYSKSAGSGNNWSVAHTIATTTLRLYDPFFVYYDGYVYYDGGNNYIARYSSGGHSDTFQALTGGLYGGVVWQGNMYGYQGQKVYKLTTAPSVTDMITIPVDQTIKQMIPYGNYLAIVCSAVNSGAISKMYLWDGVTTTTFADVVEIGVGSVSGGNILDGVIYAVQGFGNLKGFKILAYSGGRFVTVCNYTGRFNRARTYNYTLPVSTVKVANGFIYFIVSGTRADSAFANIYEAQVFRYGRLTANDTMSLTCWKTLNSAGVDANTVGSLGNDFIVYQSSQGQSQTVGLSAVIYGLAGAGTSYYFESYSTYNATEDTSSASAILESTVFNGGNTHANKTLKKVVLTYDPLPTAGSVTLKYKINEDTNKAASTWTTIFTDTTDYNVTHAATNIESTGANLPTFKEIQFRIELSGNAKLTGLKFIVDELTEEEF